jgi:3-phosphoshikimate 1-carboxyvinyltransferase
MSEYRVHRANPINAEVRVPGDKSISHRAVMFSALANGICRVTGFLASEDCLSTMDCMRRMGVKILAFDAAGHPWEALDENGRHLPGPSSLEVHGCGMKLQAPTQDLDCGNSGTTMRLLAGIVAAQPFTSRMIGDASLSRRPMKRIMDPLGQMGADIRSASNNGCAPLVVTGGRLSPIQYTLPMASAQVKSAVLLAGLFATGETTVVEPTVTRDHTETMLKYFGVTTVRSGKNISIQGGQIPQARDFQVPGDISSAAFWAVAAAAQPGATLTITDVGLNPTRTGVLGVLKRMGADITIEPNSSDQAEPIGTVTIKGGTLHGTIIEGAEIPNVIDELPVLAVAAALAQGLTIIRDAGELRNKESDRITCVATNLLAMGGHVKELPDGMEIEGGTPLHGARVTSYGDHRIAMAFAIAGLFADGETIVEDVNCVATSYPGFDAHLMLFSQF